MRRTDSAAELLSAGWRRFVLDGGAERWEPPEGGALVSRRTALRRLRRAAADELRSLLKTRMP